MPPATPTATLFRTPAEGSGLAALADFTGRAPQLAALERHFDSAEARLAPTPTLISGPPGIGKTAFAVAAACRLTDRHPDGSLLAELRSPDGRARPASAIVAELLHAIGATGPAGRLPRVQVDRAALLQEAIAAHRCLVILDGAVSYAQVAPLLPLIGGGAVVVTGQWASAADGRSGSSGADMRAGTSRDMFEVGLGPLPDPDAMMLLERLVGLPRLTAEPDAARSIVRLCRGLPRLIREAATWITGGGAWQPAAFPALLRALTNENPALL